MAKSIIRTYRYRIYPTTKQVRLLNAHLAICCELYNAAIQERRDAWRLRRKSISFYDQAYQLKEIRAERPDIAAVNAQVLELVLDRVHNTFQGFFRRVRQGQRAGYPRFKSANRYDGLTYRQVGRCITGTKLRLSKIGNMRIKLTRPLIGKIKTLTVKREANRWFALFTVEYEASPLPYSANTVGIDLGLTNFATLSDGTAIDNPRWFRAVQAKLRRLQRRVARRKKGSSRRRKAVTLLRQFHNHIRDQRNDFLHNVSRGLINQNGLIAVEDLNVCGLARGRLAKSVNDAAWSTFIFMLSYKAEEAGRLLVKVDPRGTSQTCLCGAEVRKTLAVRKHCCLSCGLVADRDHVSAQLILAKALPSGVNVGDLMPSVA